MWRWTIKAALLIADALSDVCFGFGLPTSHIGDFEFPYKDTRQRLHGAASWFWEGAACGLLGAAIWFPSLQGGLGDGRACCLITTSKSFLAPLIHVKKTCHATSPVKLRWSPQIDLRPAAAFPALCWLSVYVCVCLVSYAKPLPSFCSSAFGRQECKNKFCSGCTRHVCLTSGFPMLLVRGLKKGPEI